MRVEISYCLEGYDDDVSICATYYERYVVEENYVYGAEVIDRQSGEIIFRGDKLPDEPPRRKCTGAHVSNQSEKYQEWLRLLLNNRKIVRAWLKKHYPNYKDPMAYWSD